MIAPARTREKGARVFALAALTMFAVVTVAAPQRHDAGTVRWTDEVRSTSVTQGCSAESGADASRTCQSHTLFVRNETDWRLTCEGEIVLKRADGDAKIKERGEVAPRAPAAIVQTMETTATRVVWSWSNCDPLPAPELVVPPECKLEIVEEPHVEYPKGARRREETGAVVVELSAPAKPGAPRDVRVVRTSGFSELDAAILKAAAAARFRTNCPDQRFRYGTKFTLTE